MIAGSGTVLNLSSMPKLFTNIDIPPIANSLNNFVPKGYFILQQQFGVSPFLAFILIALMIMMLYYLAVYILFNRLFNDQTLFENIKKPILVFVFVLGLLSAYAVGYLVYIFESILIGVAVSIFILVIILMVSTAVTGYRAGRFMVHTVASKEYSVAKERYEAEKDLYNAKKDLIKIKDRVKNMEKLLKEKRFGIKTGTFKEYEKSILNVKTVAINHLNYIERQIDRIERGISIRNIQNYNQYANMLETLVNSTNAALINNIRNDFQDIINFYKNFIYGSPQGNLFKQHISRLIVNAKNDINQEILRINNRINVVKSQLARHGVNVSRIGHINTI